MSDNRILGLGCYIPNTASKPAIQERLKLRQTNGLQHVVAVGIFLVKLFCRSDSVSEGRRVLHERMPKALVGYISIPRTVGRYALREISLVGSANKIVQVQTSRNW